MHTKLNHIEIIYIYFNCQVYISIDKRGIFFSNVRNIFHSPEYFSSDHKRSTFSKCENLFFKLTRGVRFQINRSIFRLSIGVLKNLNDTLNKILLQFLLITANQHYTLFVYGKLFLYKITLLVFKIVFLVYAANYSVHI